MRLAALPGHPSTRKSMDVAFLRKSIRYSIVMGRGNVDGKGMDMPDQM